MSIFEHANLQCRADAVPDTEHQEKVSVPPKTAVRRIFSEAHFKRPPRVNVSTLRISKANTKQGNYTDHKILELLFVFNYYYYHHY